MKRNLQYAEEQLRRARLRLVQSDFWIEDGVVKDTGDGDDPIQVLLDEARDEKERALIRMRLGID
ncbi:hypothetical protein OAV88_02325 [bacterium]|nr:hypothetical protein [bacterium]